MRPNILVVSKENHVAKSILRCCDEIDLRGGGIFQAKTIEEAKTKINDYLINIVICDSSVSQWGEICKCLKNKSPNRIFVLVADSSYGNYDDDRIDGVLCSKNFLGHKKAGLCRVIAQLFSGKV